MVPATILWQISGLSCSFHQRHTHFFISHQSNHGKSSKLVSLFCCCQIPMLPSCFVQSPPDFFYAPDICTFYALYSTVVPIMDVPLSGGSAHKPLFFCISVRWIQSANILHHKKIQTVYSTRFSTAMVPLEKLFENFYSNLLFEALFDNLLGKSCSHLGNLPWSHLSRKFLWEDKRPCPFFDLMVSPPQPHSKAQKEDFKDMRVTVDEYLKVN